MNLFKSALGRSSATPVRSRSAASNEAWASIPQVEVDVAGLRRRRIVTLDKGEPSCMPFDMLRTQLLLAMRAAGWRTLAITSPDSNCGKTLTSANLAFSFARQRNARVVLLEVDLRRPALAKLLGVKPPRSVDALLSGESQAQDVLFRIGEGLAIACATGPVADPAELLYDPATHEAIARMIGRFEPDLVICDLPPMLVSDDAAAFLGNVDCGMLIAAAHETNLEDVTRCEGRLQELTESLGVVLNKCEYSTRDYYRYTYG